MILNEPGRRTTAGWCGSVEINLPDLRRFNWIKSTTTGGIPTTLSFSRAHTHTHTHHLYSKYYIYISHKYRLHKRRRRRRAFRKHASLWRVYVSRVHNTHNVVYYIHTHHNVHIYIYSDASVYDNRMLGGQLKASPFVGGVWPIKPGNCRSQVAPTTTRSWW
jgi:hypothetical protein